MTLDFSYDLSFLYILQEYRKQGIGTKVLEHIKESCEDPLQIMIYLKQVEIYDFLMKRGFVVQSQISRSKISLKYDKKIRSADLIFCGIDVFENIQDQTLH